MTDQKTLSDDIAFIRALAAEGQRSPMMGGSILLAGGLIFGTASLAAWAQATFKLGGVGTIPAVWGVSSLLFMASLFVLTKRIARNGGAREASGMAWSGVGWAIFTIVVGLMALSARSHDWNIMAALPCVIVALYGSAWFVAASLRRSTWLYLVAFGSFAAAVINAWFAVDGLVGYLIYALSLYLLLAVPGAVMMQQARQGV